VTRDKWENGKPISSFDTGHASIEHGAKTDSDLARPPGGDHPATQQASPGVLTRSAARINTCRRMIWLRRVGMFLKYKVAYSTDSDCTELLDVFSPADALHIKYPLEPIRIYATKQGIDQYRYRLGLIRIRIIEIGEAQVMMEMIKNDYLTNLQKKEQIL
jgi:hypothetical protein